MTSSNRLGFIIGIWATTIVLLSIGCGASKSCPVRGFGNAGKFVQHLNKQHQDLISFRATASVDQWDKNGRIRGKVFLMVRRPNFLRVDVVSQFGPVATLTSNGETVAVNDKRQQRFQTGPSCPANVGKLIGVRLSASQLARVLLGEVLVETDKPMELECGGKHSYTLRASHGGAASKLVAGFDLLGSRHDSLPADQHLALRRAEVAVLGTSSQVAEYSEYHKVKGKKSVFQLPFRVRYRDKAQNIDTVIRFKEVDVNVDLPESAFSQTPLPGFKQQSLVCPKKT